MDLNKQQKIFYLKLENLFNNELIKFINFNCKNPNYDANNKKVLSLLSNIYNIRGNEILYLILNKEKLRTINIFCSCGNKNKFFSLKRGYQKHCCSRCAALDNNVQKKLEQTSLKKYGVRRPTQNSDILNKIKLTKFERYGDENYTNLEKHKQMCLIKYGLSHHWKSKNPKLNGRAKCKELYGNESFSKTKFFIETLEKTCLKKYGKKYFTQTSEMKNKTKQTCLDKYGVEFSFQSENNKNKSKITCLNKYGVEYFSQSKKYRDLYKNKEWVNNTQQKIYLKHKQNNSFNTSKPEDRCYELLKSKFNDVIRNYSTDSRYPFNCDFYIPSKDLFIECHFHWTHGGTPFNKDNQKHLKQLEKWRSKNTQFYKNAEKVWTERDPLKLKTFIDNKLNYKIFYREKEFIWWFRNDCKNKFK